MEKLQGSVLGRLGDKLRARTSGITEKPLPQRWVDLLRQLNEQEQKTSARASQGEEQLPHKPVFHFNLVLGSSIAVDTEGQTLPNVYAARAEAIASAQEIIAERMRSGRPVGTDERVEVANGNGEVLFKVRLVDVHK